MRKTAYILSLALCVGSACSQEASKNDSIERTAFSAQNPNPTNDPDVQRGYDQHQKEYQEKQEAAKQSEIEAKKEEGFRVDKSGGAHGGVPTQGQFDPQENKQP